jgi:hypothetical protein
MNENVDLKACTILERLTTELGTATVDYTCTQDMHAFQVTTRGITHEVGFAQRVLELENLPDIEQVVSRVAEALRQSSEPRRIRIDSRRGS